MSFRGITVLSLILLVSVCVWLWSPRETPIPPGALFVVNGNAFRSADLEALMGHEAQFASLGEAEDTVRAVVDQLILEREANRRYAAGQNVSPENVLARMVTETASASGPSEREIEAYYEAHRDEYVGTRAVTFDIVTVLKSDRSEDARRQISALRVRAEMNLEFSRGNQVAMRRPDGAKWVEVASLPCEGETREREAFPPEKVRRVACSLPTGLVSRPIETPTSWHLVRVTAQRAARNTSLERAAGEIRMLLAEQAQNARWTDALAKLRDDADVVVSRSALMELVDAEDEHSVAADAVPSRPPMPPGAGGQSS